MTASLLSTVIIFLFSLIYTISAFALPFGNATSPGPGMLPTIIGVLACAISMWQLVLEFLKRKAVAKTKVDYPWRVVWFMLAFAAYIIVFKPLGYVIATVLFTTVLMLLMENKWHWSVLTGIVTGFVFNVVFSWLSVPLPKGILAGLKLF